MSNLNKGVPGAKEFYPINEPSIGSSMSPDVFHQNKELPALFKPLTLRGVTFPNRVFVSPMCQYSSDNGHATDWHLVHIGGFATRGAGAIIMEATAIVPEGRISPEDAGLWTDSQIAPLKRIVDFAHAQGSKIGIQLAHAGRKASTLAPWMKTNAARTHRADTWIAQEDERGWPNNVYGPSAIPWSDHHSTPKALTEEDLQYVEDAFVASTKRAIEAGFDFIELHFAHGYLFHAFLSPLSNIRTDAYGGESYENRIRYPMRVMNSVRAAWGDRPLFVRLSGTDWAEGPERGDDGKWKQWGIEQTKAFSGELLKAGADLIDMSTGGNWSAQKIPVAPGFQVPFAEEVKKAYPQLVVGSVGLITDAKQANDIIESGRADVVLLARGFIRDPNFVLHAAETLGAAVKPAVEYERGWTQMLAPKKD
ncbi:FMN-linked oxidoreductase [Auriscalpium vulgare]|uniref:FMN-linked oxidoreductase n=1 Tax=Auriscalpium vulgare TaxID=40419 RepID=A0ACB8RFS0_9AGAM|nr:FMN-linked oxidoreductase [Auriscalpium vulgare]